MTCRSLPTWEHYIGLRLVEDIGNGMGLRLTWGRALATESQYAIHYNIYYSSTRFGVFSEGPKAITTSCSVVLNEFEPGDLHYLAIRATQFDPDEFDITTLTQIGVGVRQYPIEQTLLGAISDAYGTAVEVEDGGNFPDAGFLLVGSEIMKYASKTANVFYIEDTNRGAEGTTAETHETGESVSLWHGFEDNNSSILLNTAAWYYTNGTPRNLEELGEFNVDEDGYRAANENIITADSSAIEENAQHFPSYDYTGYHRPSLQDTFSGECVNSYVGGEFNGGRGLFFQDRVLARLDSMLQLTGEPVVLLKRKWSGRRCRCGASDLRREHPRTRCPYCYGSGFDGGYDRFVNSRAISEDSTNSQGVIMVRVNPWTDDLELSPDQGLNQPVELTAWTLTIPVLRDRDVIKRYNEDGTVEFMYEVLDVVRNKLVLGSTGRQNFRMRRLDKTDILYTFNTNI